MCGIVGVCGPPGRVMPDALRFPAMVDALVSRGPDARGEWHDDAAGIALGHRRLSILDLSAAGAQPMASRCGRYVLAFNGEIYNFRALRADLERSGVAFAGHSDTEVLVEACSRDGLAATLARLNGMFALALWDRQTRRLALARDRIGEKPLYYGWHDGLFLFTSELKALHAWPGFRPRVDTCALALYLRHNYVPEPHCIYAGWRKLVPGTWVEIDAAAAQVLPEPRPYWTLADTLRDAHAAPFSGSEAAAIEAVEAALRDAVGLRMVADVPLGAFLSGGIDSSLIVALMQAQSTSPVRTFSIGFESTGFDEAPYARAVAAHLGTQHTELYVSPEQTRAVIPELPSIYDEPFADSSQIPTLLVSRLARQDVTVALSGDAGDELFAGYTRYALAQDLWTRGQRWPRPLRAGASALLRGVSPQRWDRLFATFGPLLPTRARQPSPGDKLHKLARLLTLRDPLETYLSLISLWQDPARLLPGVVEPSSILAHAAGLPAGLRFTEQMMALDTLHYLPGDILTKVDRASMAVGLEARVPFLDPDLIALAWRLPHALKVRDGDGKWVLREVLARHVPRALFERPKMGFGVPIGEWLRGPLRDWAETLLATARLRDGGLFDPLPIRTAWQAHLAGGENLQYHLWGILMFEAWRERWAAGSAP